MVVGMSEAVVDSAPDGRTRSGNAGDWPTVLETASVSDLPEGPSTVDGAVTLGVHISAASCCGGADIVLALDNTVKGACTVREMSRAGQATAAAASVYAGVHQQDWNRARPLDLPSACHPWLSMNAIGRDRHSSSGSAHGEQMQKLRAGGSASGLGDAVLMLTTGQNKRWSVAGAAPELTLLRVKLDDVQRELCELQSKHEVMTMEYQDVLNELECCRQSKARLDQEVHDAKMEAMRWKKDFELLVQQKQFSERQVLDLQLKLQTRQAELDELRRQYRDVLDGAPMQSGDIPSNLMEEYDEMCVEANGLKERCRLLETEIIELRGCFRLAQEEFRHLHMSREEELESQRRKICALEERQVALYQQLHKIAQDRDILRSENDMLKQQMQDLCSDITRNLGGRQKLEEDMRLLRRQHDGVLSEYHHVMSERDTVLKENERLAEEKSVLMKKLKTNESDRQALLEQLKTMEVKLEVTDRERQELQLQLKVRDDELSSLAGGGGDGDSGMQCSHFAETKSISSIETELMAPGGKRRAEDDLRRLADGLKEELTNARQEIQGAKQQRDWALAERQRVVSEREEMRTMSESLRMERDEAVTNLAIAIRDADALRRQREHAEREVRRYRELLEKGDHRVMMMTNVESTPSNSHDSAIDTDMAEWEVETLQFNMSGCQKTEDLGLVLRGGRDDVIAGHVVPIYVKSVAAGSRLDGLLRTYDCIMQVNNIDVSLMDRRSVMDILRNSNSVKMAIRRRRLVGMKLISVPLTASSDGDVGIVFEDGVYVSKLKTSSAAAKAGNLAVGDRLIYVNDIPVQNRSAESVAQLIADMKGCGLVLAVMKSPPILSPMTPTSSGYSCYTNASSSSKSGGGRFDTSQCTEAAPSSSGTVKRKDASVQTFSAADAPAQPQSKKHESLLEKAASVHDKLFGRSDRKVAGRVVASPSMEDYNSDGSGRRFRPSSSASHRRQRPSSVYGNYTVVDRSKSATAEQQVLQQLDSILEASEKEHENRPMEKAMNFDRSAAGGTWPKYKPTALTAVACSPLATSGSPCSTVLQTPLDGAPKLSSSAGRRGLLPFFHAADKYKCETRLRSSIVSPLKLTRCAAESSRPISYHPCSYFNGHGSLTAQGQGRYLSRPMSPFVNSIAERRPSDVDGGDSSSPAMSVFKQQLQVAHATPVVATGSSSARTYFPPMPSFPRAGSNTPTSIDQELDQRSLNSQSSDSRTAFSCSVADQSSTKSLCNRTTGHHPLLSFSSSEDYASSSSGGRLSKGDVRTLFIEKRSSHEGLGISIASSGIGVFVSSVSENSLAARHGLQVGDQLLEVCGINMRSASLAHASNVLSHLGRSEQITLMVQYNPAKYCREMSDYRSSACSTPKAAAVPKAFLSHDLSSSLSHGTAHSHELLNQCNIYFGEPRFVFIKRDGDDWGFTLIGGNAVGIFVDDVKAAVSAGGLRTCDQVLEFDGVNFRKLTLEQALFELAGRQAGCEVSMLVQYNEAKYQQCKRCASDSFYVRATIDRQAENTDELSFKTGDILRVDNTVFNGVMGLWRAWLVDQEGRERSCGIIPSRSRLEEELMFRRSGSEISTLEGGSDGGGGGGGAGGVGVGGCGGSRKGTIRRSLKFIRRSSRSGHHHQRTPSKESPDMDADCPTAAAMDEQLYQRVERIDYKQKRPVLILGALVDVIVLKLLEEYPKLFAQCVPECVKPMPVAALDQGLMQNVYVDYRKRDKLFEITRVAVVKDLIDKGYHCVLHVSPMAIERLHRLQIYPVVIFVKLKSAKQIKELCDDRLNSKQAKEMFDNACKLETEYHHLFSAVISGPHHSVKQICQQIACTVEHEQKKTLWIISGESM